MKLKNKSKINVGQKLKYYLYWIHLIQIRIKLNINSIYSSNKFRKNQFIIYPIHEYDGTLIFSNIYNDKENITRSYFQLGGNPLKIRFFPEYFIHLISKYFSKNDMDMQNWLNLLFNHKYKHGYHLTNCMNDIILFKYYKKNLNKYFITNNYHRQISITNTNQFKISSQIK